VQTDDRQLVFNSSSLKWQPEMYNILLVCDCVEAREYVPVLSTVVVAIDGIGWSALGGDALVLVKRVESGAS
jgi:hypothetical protein